jgi:hypothetical protein
MLLVVLAALGFLMTLHVNLLLLEAAVRRVHG